MQNKKLVIIAIFFAIVIASLSIIGHYLGGDSRSTSVSASLIINILGQKKADSYSGAQITALDLLKRYHSVNTSSSSYGEFVECINEVCSDNINNHYWMYYINNEMAPVGAGNYYVLYNDTIEFRYE